MAGKHGGQRAGAGRPPKVSAPSKGSGASRYATAADYLAAVVSGAEEPNATRVAAARAMLPYERPRQRAPVRAAALPKDLAVIEEAAQEGERQASFHARAAEIRRKRGRSG